MTLVELRPSDSPEEVTPGGRHDNDAIPPPGPSQPSRGTLHTAPGSTDPITAASLQIAARDAYRQSAMRGNPLTGEELGSMFDRSGRWGRLQVTAARAGMASGDETKRLLPSRHRAPGDAPAMGATGAATTVAPQRHTETATAAPRPASPGKRNRNGETAVAQPETVAAAKTAMAKVAEAVEQCAAKVAVLVVGVVAAWASYEHQRSVAVMAGEEDLAPVLPLSVDGLIIAAMMKMQAQQRAGEPVGALPWVSFLAGVGASLAANIVAAEPTFLGRCVAAWPPLALLLAHALLTHRTKEATS
jgi:Protein of unknown function (DUF2637)